MHIGNVGFVAKKNKIDQLIEEYEKGVKALNAHSPESEHKRLFAIRIAIDMEKHSQRANSFWKLIPKDEK